MFSLKTRILAKHFRPDIDFDNLNVESLAWLKLIEAKTGGNPVRNATIENGIAYFDGVTVSQPLVSLKLNIPVTQTGSGTPSPDNIRDIIGVSGVNVTRTGKNLFCEDFSAYYKPANYYIFPIRLERGATYQFWATNTGDIVKDCVIGYAKDGDRYPFPSGQVNVIKVDGTTQARTFTVDSSFINPVLIFYGDETTFNSLLENYTIQLEKGSEATPYEPYIGNTYQITFGQTVYSAILDVLTGKLYLIDEIKTIDENTSIAMSSTLPSIFGLPAFFNKNNDTDSLDCNAYMRADNQKSGTAVKDNNPDYSFCCSTVTKYGYIKDTRFTSVEDYKTWLSTNPVKIAVKLAEPIEIDLTPTQITTLIGENVIFADVADVTECKYTRK